MIYLILRLLVFEYAKPTLRLLYLRVALCDVPNQQMVARSCVNALTFRSDLAPVSFINLAFLVHLFYFVLERIINVLVPLFVVLGLGQLQLCLRKVLLTVVSFLLFNYFEVIIRNVILLLCRLLVFFLIQIELFIKDTQWGNVRECLHLLTEVLLLT